MCDCRKSDPSVSLPQQNEILAEIQRREEERREEKRRKEMAKLVRSLSPLSWACSVRRIQFLQREKEFNEENHVTSHNRL